MPLTTTVEGLQRYTINLRYDRDFRPTSDALKRDIIVPTPTGAQIPLGQLGRRSRSWTARWASRARAPCPTPGCMWTFAAWTWAPTCRMAMHAVNEAVAARRNQTAPRLQHFLERPIRIHAARQAAPADGRAADAADHHADHLSEHEIAAQDRHRACWRCRSRWSARSGRSTCCTTI